MLHLGPLLQLPKQVGRLLVALPGQPHVGVGQGCAVEVRGQGVRPCPRGWGQVGGQLAAGWPEASQTCGAYLYSPYLVFLVDFTVLS